MRAQLQAAEDLGVRGWILWNAQNHYTWSAIKAGPIVKLPPEAPKPPKPLKTKPAKPAAVENKDADAFATPPKEKP